jgi:pyrroloquinoline quinone (PQQ) biosynthesis protein C
MNSGIDDQNFETSLLPAQYNALVRGRRWAGSEAELGLMLAVLKDAVRIYLSDRNATTRERRVRFEETRRWFAKRSGRRPDGLFAYENLCEALGIDPDHLRARLGLEVPPATATSGKERR